jgi:hypothetical protein
MNRPTGRTITTHSMRYPMKTIRNILLTLLFSCSASLMAGDKNVTLNEHLKDHAWQLGTWTAKNQNGNTWVITFAAALDGNAILLDGKQINKQGNTIFSMHGIRSYDPEDKALVTTFKSSSEDRSWSNKGSIKPGMTSFRTSGVNDDGQLETRIGIDKEMDADTYHNVGITVDENGKATPNPGSPWEHKRVKSD